MKKYNDTGISPNFRGASYFVFIQLKKKMRPAGCHYVFIPFSLSIYRNLLGI